ncbi:MAG: hypothetical protein LBR15_03555 [Methanobrevibacter sp.]|jgi:anti-anti-sigma regulatory factor|nr:hypothetical protein [Candidatus Methanovirga australis]
MSVKKLIIKELINSSLEFNAAATDLINEIENMGEDEIIIDFTDVVFISRSFAQAYVSGKIKSFKTVKEVNIPVEVEPMLKMIENNFNQRIKSTN